MLIIYQSKTQSNKEVFKVKVRQREVLLPVDVQVASCLTMPHNMILHFSCYLFWSISYIHTFKNTVLYLGYFIVNFSIHLIVYCMVHLVGSV